jgi:hypothetical protein
MWKNSFISTVQLILLLLNILFCDVLTGEVVAPLTFGIMLGACQCDMELAGDRVQWWHVVLAVCLGS